MPNPDLNTKRSAQTASDPGSSERFGYEWARYREIRAEHQEQFRRWTAHIAPIDWHGKWFLDVGCGIGRNSYWAMTYGAAGGKAIDIDARSLGAARENLACFPEVTVEARSAYEIVDRDFYDITFSIGVIHHLEDPALALTRMTQATKPGGKVLIWVYGLENNEWIVRFFNPLRRALFSRLPIGFVHHLSIYPAIMLWLGLRLGVGRIAYFDLLRSLAFPHMRAIVFDQMLPAIANYWPRATVEALLTSQGLTDVKLTWINEMSWSAIGTKEAASQA